MPDHFSLSRAKKRSKGGGKVGLESLLVRCSLGRLIEVQQHWCTVTRQLAFTGFATPGRVANR
jgi:hypothetical protein